MPQPKPRTINTAARLFAYTKPYKGTLLLTIILTVLLAAIAPLRPYLIQLSVDKYIAGGWLQGLILISIIHFGVLLIESGLRFWFLYRINWLGQTVVNDLRKAVFGKIIRQNLHYFDTNAIGTLTTRTVNDIEAVNEVFSQGLISIVADVLTILAIVTIMLLTDWQLALICLTTFPALVVATYFFKESVKKSFQRVRNAVAALNAFVQEHISGMYIVQAFAAENREDARFREINKEHRDANIKAIFAYSVFFPIVEIILAISMGLLVWWGARRMLSYEVTPGVIVAFILYLNLLFRPLRMLADKFNVLQMGIVAGNRIFTVMDSEDYQQNNGSYQPQSIEGEIEFREVHFSYKPGVPVLRGISFALPAGHMLAVVGPTGAGKTSIISILNRLYEIESGEIRIDGRNLTDYDMAALRSRIGIVLQDVFLFSGTVLENITLRNEAISREAVVQACQLLGLHKFIMQLPGDYDFNVLERGSTLSQGQRQLVSFARALLYNPAILILDEATSSIDSESEMLIQNAIEKLTKGRTSIVIAHRLSTIRKADEILVLEQGLIVERGNHTELIAQQGAYHKLYTAVEKAAQEG